MVSRLVVVGKSRDMLSILRQKLRVFDCDPHLLFSEGELQSKIKKKYKRLLQHDAYKIDRQK